MSQDEYFSELDYHPDTIEAALAEGLITAWRTDPSGTRWFKSSGRGRMIRGVPAADDGFAAPSGFLDGDDDGVLGDDHGDDAGADGDDDGVLGDDSDDDA